MSKIVDGLKWLGEEVRKGVGIIGPFIPVLRLLAGATATKADDRALDIYDGLKKTVQIVEVSVPAAHPEATGADKARAALAIVAPMIRLAETAKGDEIVDEVEFTAACQDFINASVRMQKCIQHKT